MIGGKGNDTYVVDGLSEIITGITELAGSRHRHDRNQRHGGVTLAANVENMTYTGSSAWLGIAAMS